MGWSEHIGYKWPAPDRSLNPWRPLHPVSWKTNDVSTDLSDVSLTGGDLYFVGRGLHREGHFAVAGLSFPLAFSDVRSSP